MFFLHFYNTHLSYKANSFKEKNFNVSRLFTSLLLFTLIFSFNINAQTNNVTTPKEHFGFNIGDDYNLATYTQLTAYWKKIDSESDRMKLVEIGKTSEGRSQYMAIITSPDNFKYLEKYRSISKKLALAEGLTDQEAKQLSKDGKAVIWIDGGLHANEIVGAHQIIETSYELVSRNDEETLRFLDDLIILIVHANPDGMELVSNWYMRNPIPEKRSTSNIPRLYQKYIGHDNNRDSYMSSQMETENLNRIMYIEWFPQIMYNHHQTGPSDIIVFVPPFRDPPNYNYNPLLMLGNQSVGLAIHNRLVAENKGGSGMRSTSNYSIWYNGSIRTNGYFHNQIGMLTEIKGNPTPMNLAFFPDRQIKSSDFPLPHTPGVWHFKDAIDYSLTMNRAVLDYAQKNKEQLLYNRYLMGKSNIELGSKDSWTIHPKIVDEVVSEIKETEAGKKEMAPTFRRRSAGVSYDYLKLFKKPENRDPRAYVMSADQKDYPTVVKFVNTFIKSGVTVHIATDEFKLKNKIYPAGSFVVKTAQAFRPEILDMFEPQDHPSEFKYEGGPPIPPYDNAGWTLAYQMGIEFDRILDSFDGPFKKVEGFAKPIPGKVTDQGNVVGYILSNASNDAFKVVNKLLKMELPVYSLLNDLTINNANVSKGNFYFPKFDNSKNIVSQWAAELGVDFIAVSSKPVGEVIKINPIRIALWDRYGGSIPSGWVRWIMEQFEFPYKLVFPKELNAGNLKNKFDVIVFPSGAIPPLKSNNSFRRRRQGPKEEDTPKGLHYKLGKIDKDKTIPQLQKFVKQGGSIITIGSSTNLAAYMNLPIGNHIVNRFGEALKREEYYIPGSVLNMKVNNDNPISFGLNEHVDVMFNNSPVFRLQPKATEAGVKQIGLFDSDNSLRSGWAWGLNRLYGGTALAEVSIGKGTLYLFGPEILYRGQAHSTYKLFFNGIYLSNGEKIKFSK